MDYKHESLPNPLVKVEHDLETDIKEEEEEEEDEEEMELEVEIKDIVKEDNKDNDELCQVTSSSSKEKDASKSDKQICGVCGSVAKSSHFGGVCCDSCKAFFRRCVQSKAWETFLCFTNGQCNIKENRRCCQACRFKRCQAIGMDVSLVMTEEERKALMIRKLERRKKLLLERQRLGNLPRQTDSDTQRNSDQTSDVAENNCIFVCEDKEENSLHAEREEDNNDCLVIEILSKEGKSVILGLQRLLRRALTFPRFPQHYYEENADIIEHLFFVFCKSMGNFFNFIPDFRNLDTNDQKILLKPAVAKSIFIYGTHQYEHERQCWPKRLLTPLCTFPTITMAAAEKFIDDYETVYKWKAFIAKYISLFSDEVVMVLTLLVTLFDSGDLKLVGHRDISFRKAKYLKLLEDYIQQYYSTFSLSNIMHQVNDALTDAHVLSECFEDSSTKVKEQNTPTRQQDPLLFSSTLDEGARLPLKKALCRRDRDISKERDITEEVIFLEDCDSKVKENATGYSDEMPSLLQNEYGTSVDEQAAFDTCDPLAAGELPSDVGHHKEKYHDVLLPESAASTTLPKIPRVIKTKELIIRPLPPETGPYQLHRNKWRPGYSPDKSIPVENMRAVIVPVSHNETHRTSSNPLQQYHQNPRHAPEADTQNRGLTPSQLDLLHRLGVQGDSNQFLDFQSRERLGRSVHLQQYLNPQLDPSRLSRTSGTRLYKPPPSYTK